MLQLPKEKRRQLWHSLVEVLLDYEETVGRHAVTPELNPEKLRLLLKPFDFTEPRDPQLTLDFVLKGLWDHQTHTPHPRYYGLFNPRSTTLGTMADAIVAVFNPQLAAWSHSPLAQEIESHLVHAFGERFGYELPSIDGTFASGGAEANHTAVLTALVRSFPTFAAHGLQSLPARPVLYISAEGHHSFLKAARLCGLGTDGVREIPVTDDLQMDCEALSGQILQDRRSDLAPFLIVATAGTTNAGVVDPIARIAELAQREDLWLHLDAAWGGAAAFVPELRWVLNGSERADSITFDAHKWLSVPMGAGIYLTRHPEILMKTFGTDAPYMPREAKHLDVIDPYNHSMQWSRRFTGLKVFLSLAVAGWDVYAQAIRHQTAMGRLLRDQLQGAAWEVVNPTPLPVACFVDRSHPKGATTDYLEAVAAALVASGRAWISTTLVGRDRTVLRACITNYLTGPEDVKALVQDLNEARAKLQTH